ncbi:serine/threonine-protein kinase [Neobacillus drentensis]
MFSVDIGGFDIRRKLFSNDFGLSVFEVVETETARTFILRLVDFSNKATDFKKAQWNQLQEGYRTGISDYSHLPRIEQVAQVDEGHLYSLLECEEGVTLVEKGQLDSDQINQLVAAVRHLHDKRIVHGALSPENIWISTQGRVILYGAGEAKVLEGKGRLGNVSDVRQLISIIQRYSTVSERVIENLNLEEPMTIEELEQILTRPERKMGISDDNKLAAFFERKSLNQKAEAAERERKKAKKGKRRGTSMLILGGAVLVVMMILAFYFLF